MDLDPLMRKSLQRLDEVFAKFARARGWAPDDLHWYYRVSPVFGRILALLVAPGFGARNYLEEYRELQAFVNSELADQPGFAEAVGLVLRTPQQVAEAGPYGIPPDLEEYQAARLVAS